MATITPVLQQQQHHPPSQQSQEHKIELMCRICAADFKIASEGVPIFNTDQLMDKIQNYLHIQVNNLDKLSHLVCNECVRKIENFHCYAMMAHKNQELFSIMYSEKIYREHCTALSSLNTTLYREPPSPQVQPVQAKSPNTITIQPTPPIKKQKMQKIQPQPQQNKPIKLPSTTVITPAPPQSIQQQQQQQQQQNSQQQPVAVLSTEDITIFTYQDLKLGQVIKDQELQKLILRALKWNEIGKPIESQLERLKNASFRGVLNNPDLLRDEDLVQLLGPYLDHGSFAPLDTSQRPTNMDFSTKMLDQNVTEMEVGVDPDLFFPFDDDESKGIDIEVTKVVKPKKERKKSEARANKAASKKNSAAGSSSANTVLSTPPKIRIKTEGLFKPVSQSLSKNTVPHPKPIIVVPTATPKNASKSIATPKVKIVVPEPAKQSVTPIIKPIEKPVIVQTPPSVPIEPVASAEVTTTTTSPASASTVQNNNSDTPSTIVTSVQQSVNITGTNAIVTTVDATAVTKTVTTSPATPVVTVPVPVLTPSPVVATPPPQPATVASKPTPKLSTAKVEPRVRQARNLKNDQSGPKTRARSIFNTRHKCAVCGKRFATSGNLKAHVKTHKPKGKFNCDKCGRVFKTQTNLQRHKEYHSGEKFSCRTCGRVYPSNSTLKQHEISHSNVRPHKCNICMKTFKRSQDLKFHINQHTGDRPYQCQFCPKAFASSGNCFSHRKRVHSDKAEAPIPAPIIAGSKRTNTVENAKKLMKA